VCPWPQHAPTVLESRWGLNFTFYWAPYAIAGVGALLLAATFMSQTERRPVTLRQFLPWCILLFLVILSTYNISYDFVVSAHSTIPTSMVERDYIQFLPSTISVRRTILHLLQGGGTLLVFAATYTSLRYRSDAKVILRILYVNGLVLALVGSALFFYNTPLLLGLFAIKNPTFFATFDYKNHWVAFAVLSATCGFTLALWSHKPRDGKTQEYWFCMTSVGLILLTLPLRGSRTGLIVLVLAIAMLGLYLLRHPGRMRRSRSNLLNALCGIAAPIFGLLLWAGLSDEHERTQGSFSSMAEDTFREVDEFAKEGKPKLFGARQIPYQMALPMVMNRPMWGWGAGSHLYALPIALSAESDDEKDRRLCQTFEYIHSDPLQLVIELGIIGSILFILPPALLLRKALRAKGDDRNPLPIGVPLGGVALFLIVACIDFPLANPANSVFLAVVFAIAVKMPFLASSRSSKRSLMDAYEIE
jgi:hypothetical protein